jgi:hypothetical protein
MNVMVWGDATTSQLASRRSSGDGEEWRGGGNNCRIDDRSWRKITTITYMAIEEKPASRIPEEDRNENQGTATLVPTKKKSLIHTRNKKITW